MKDLSSQLSQLSKVGSFIPRSPQIENALGERASSVFKHLRVLIREFDAEIDSAHQLGVRLVSFGQAVVIQLRGITYRDPSLIILRGLTDSGDPVELIQHVSQLSILLMKLPRIDKAKPKPKIGFDAP